MTGREPAGAGALERVGLLERLMRAVRPEFRADVFRPGRDDAVFVRGECRLVNCLNMVGHPVRGLCDSHYQRWLHDPHRGGWEDWLAAEDERLLRRGVAPVCGVSGCNRSTTQNGLCQRHHRQWARRGRPEQTAWLAQVDYTPTEFGEADCQFPGCPRWAESAAMPYCHHHYARWKVAGRPDMAGWYAGLAREAVERQVPHVKLGRLGRHARLEVQYGLQCRHDEAVKRTPMLQVTTAVKHIVDAGVTSLLDLDEPGWRKVFGAGRRIPCGQRDYASVSLRFVLDTRMRLIQLLIADDPWADQYPRDTWDLRLLGIPAGQPRLMHFGGIPQLWLRGVAKRWCRWRLARGVKASTVARNAIGVACFGRHLAAHAGSQARPADLTRERIESWLPTVAVRDHVGALSVFLRDVHRHDWLPDLPAGAFVFTDDAPPPRPAKPRFISEHLMRQLEAESNLALFDGDDARLVTRILINCGLRLKDARRLPFDCVVRDNTGAGYLAWVNHKIRERVAFFPISDTLAGQIADQQRRVLDRYPAGCGWLFPARKVNLNGSRPMPDISYRDYLNTWLRRIRLVDEHDRPTSVTPHQFRHTVATRLINADVPLHIVQQLLDHMSREMTAVYARLHNKTLRRHWENAVKVNADGQTTVIPADHPLADAAWMRLSMVRAKVTLPNGYCGAPVQTDCEYANPCLDCRFFITTTDFLDQHRRQRDETTKLIDDAQRSGLARIAERNRRTLGKLDAIIDALETSQPGQIVAGGVVEDLGEVLDAAG
ncbi:site-specific recombinase XerD [Micromonospora sp. Llam0]|uniref:tyrosine-type recombinase/integrase n=1 Tax=Micromonospora sp. Llam0 TaxID=2485143 RepID=UPI000FACD280|nr:tyrosine-type recombinase/integrase [Micromonospora sp. Llam0]ROO59112.1 site-specific recombinase XerD [Micromonospora sp. Llam0]